MAKKKEKEKPLWLSILLLPYYAADALLKLIIGIPVGLFMALVDYSKKHY